MPGLVVLLDRREDSFAPTRLLPVTRRHWGAICAAIAAATAFLPCLAFAGADASETRIDFQHAKRQIKHFTAMTCTQPCRHRAYECQRHSPSRVSCRSWTLTRSEGVIYPENEFVIERETCKWVTVATPFEGSATKLRLQAEHFRCNLKRTNKDGERLPDIPEGIDTDRRPESGSAPGRGAAAHAR